MKMDNFILLLSFFVLVRGGGRNNAIRCLRSRSQAKDVFRCVESSRFGFWGGEMRYFEDSDDMSTPDLFVGHNTEDLDKNERDGRSINNPQIKLEMSPGGQRRPSVITIIPPSKLSSRCTPVTVVIPLDRSIFVDPDNSNLSFDCVGCNVKGGKLEGVVDIEKPAFSEVISDLDTVCINFNFCDGDSNDSNDSNDNNNVNDSHVRKIILMLTYNIRYQTPNDGNGGFMNLVVPGPLIFWGESFQRASAAVAEEVSLEVITGDRNDLEVASVVAVFAMVAGTLILVFEMHSMNGGVDREGKISRF